ncbi:MAG: 16S rRNA (cytidine(1402)-2'-O)-methyltransferase [Desulfatitalea sp.]
MPSISPTPESMAPGLYVVTTPIGHLADITLRALSVLAGVELIAAEDTRHTRRLLDHYKIQNRLVSYHEHNEVQRTAELIERLAQGAAIALVSDAGTPTVSDPGFRLVQAAVAHGIAVIPIPGVSAAITALSVSGLPTDQFTFVGFPARKRDKRRQQLQALAHLPHTLIFYQSPQRLTAFMAELVEILGDRPAVLAREMTKVHEEYLRAPLSQIIATLEARDSIKGECTLLVAAAAPVEPLGEEALDQAIRQALAQKECSLSDLAKALAARFHVSRKQIYDRALELKKP